MTFCCVWEREMFEKDENERMNAKVLYFLYLE